MFNEERGELSDLLASAIVKLAVAWERCLFKLTRREGSCKICWLGLLLYWWLLGREVCLTLTRREGSCKIWLGVIIHKICLYNSSLFETICLN